jgi:hypothetical protein
MTEEEWLTSDHLLDLMTLIRGRISDRKLRLIGLACCGYPRPFCDPRLTAFAEVIARYAEGLVRYEAVLATREVAIAEPCSPGAAFTTYDREVLCLDDFSKADAWSGLSGLLSGFRSHGEEDQALGRWCQTRAWCDYIRDVTGNPYQFVIFDTSWRTADVVLLGQGMYESRDFGAMPILADALQDAGCDSADILDHCRGPGPHVRGCWVADLVLGKS